MLVSVIIPYNQDRGFLQKCIDSIELQTVVCEIILSYGPDKSVAQNFNWGLSQATGEFVKVVGEDDWLPDDALENLLEGIGDAPWVVGNAWNVIGNNYELYKPETLDFERNRQHNLIHNGGTMYRTQVLRAIGGMNEDLWTAEEYDMHLRLYVAGYHPVYLDKAVYFYRQHGDQKYKKLNRADRERRQTEIKRIQDLYV